MLLKELPFPLPSYGCRSQGKKEEAVLLLRDSIQYGPEFADAYSSLASLLAEWVKNVYMPCPHSCYLLLRWSCYWMERHAYNWGSALFLQICILKEIVTEKNSATW